ncbi:hypothetical protein ACISU4_09235 [Streptomyces wuyuanensis]|uniref:hypothetical protein n=1 Tax=Streptomyces wuyuanensis TaxID=1196353 RepID=UPI0037FB8DCF
MHNAKKKKCNFQIDHVGQVDQDWVTKGAHLNMKDGMEVALRPDGKGGITGEAIRLSKDTATQKQVDAVIDMIKSNPKLREDMTRVTKAAKEVFESSAKAMKEGRNPQRRFSNDRTEELQQLIDAIPLLRRESPPSGGEGIRSWGRSRAAAEFAALSVACIRLIRPVGRFLLRNFGRRSRVRMGRG